MKIGERIKQARTERNLTQKELAKKVGIKQPSLSELEKGETKQPKASTLISIAYALSVNPRWIMTGEDPKEITGHGLSPTAIELAKRISDLEEAEIQGLVKLFAGSASLEKVEEFADHGKRKKKNDRRVIEVDFAGTDRRNYTIPEPRSGAPDDDFMDKEDPGGGDK